MGDKELERVIDSEIEWRRYILKKVDQIDSRLNSFMIKVLSYATALVVATEMATKYLLKG